MANVRDMRAVGLCIALASSAGCQLVFGIDDYEIGADGAGSTSAGAGSNDGGAGGTSPEGGQGGVPSNGGAPPGHCTCDLDASWVPMNLDGLAPVDGPFPDCANADVARTVLFDGRPIVACAPCVYAASGCEVEGIECFGGSNCSGSQRHLDPGTTCSDIGSGGCKSFELTAEPTAPACELQAGGGQPTVADPAFERYLLFCGIEECGPGCRTVDAECIVADNFTAAECPGGFPNRYDIDEHGTPSCEACTAAASCSGPWYGAGAATNCDIVDLNEDCTTIVIGNAYSIARKTQPSCSANHDALYNGTYEITSRRTVCCQNPIGDIPPPR